MSLITINDHNSLEASSLLSTDALHGAEIGTDGCGTSLSSALATGIPTVDGIEGGTSGQSCNR